MTPEEKQAYEQKARLAAEKEAEQHLDEIKTRIQLAFLSGVQWGLQNLKP